MTAVGLIQLVASLIAGALWDRVGRKSAFIYGAVFGVLGSPALVWLIPATRGPWYETSEHDVRGPRICIIPARVTP
jgi:MFS family permease